MKKDVKLNNVLFPVWLLPFFSPLLAAAVIFGNFVIDSFVLLAAAAFLKIENKKHLYGASIFKVFIFGLIADFIGAAGMFFAIYLFDLGTYGDELYLTVPGVILSAILIYVFDYYFSFKKLEDGKRRRLALIFAVVTAPYTFLIPSGLIYGF